MAGGLGFDGEMLAKTSAGAMLFSGKSDGESSQMLKLILHVPYPLTTAA